MTDKILVFLLEVSVYSTVLFLAIALFRLMLKKHLSPAMLYMAWFLVIARLLLPVTLDSGFSLFVLPSVGTAQAQYADAATVTPEDSVSANVLPVQYSNSANGTTGIVQRRPKVENGAVRSNNTLSDMNIMAQPAPQLDWKMALIALWLGGVAVMLIQTIVSVIRLKIKLKRYELPVPAEWLKAMERVKAEMGITQDVKLWTAEGFTSPALNVGLRPVIIIPADKADDTERVAFILRHELTHLKRRDNIVCLLLIALRIVYWFNPVVWLTVKQIKLDMETACDSMVVASMDGAEKKRYARTVLGMFAKAPAQYVLGMALGSTKKTAERRIRGMYMRRKSTGKARLTAALLAVVMLVTCFTTACQPTPENPVVVGKDQGKMLEAAQQTPSGTQPASLSEQVGAPDKYTADITLADGKMTVKADAPVILPDVEGMPTMRVQPSDFTQEQVDGMISALFNGQTIYETQYGPKTKDDISAEILVYEKMKASDEYSSEGDQEQIDESISKLKAQYETAPDKSEDITTESDCKLKQMEIKDEDGKHMAYYMGLDVSTYSDPDDYEQGANLQVRNNNDMKEAVFKVTEHGGGGMTLRRCATLDYRNAANLAFTNWGQHTPIPVDENTVIDDTKVLAKLKMTPAQAKEAAEALLKDAGIDYMSVCAMCLVDDENLGNYDGKVSPAENYAYRIFLRRTVNGVPCAYIRGYTSSGGGTNVVDEAVKQKAEGGTPDLSAMKYVGEWAYETMEIVMNDKGVITLDWTSPLTISETVVENSALLPFDRIAAAFEQRMRDKYEPQAKEERIASMEFIVGRVSLELQRIAEQDSLDTGLLVPVWNFYGTETDGYNDQGGVIKNKNGFNGPRPILTVNAIDASVIDNDLGY